ncbi:putative Dedicator of cytokinesis protein 3 [Blattamonas nauphoetae]|uniref:Dedicator of cytokinesis protein 3 n=1 Tax=Blattamonas nauphoetae TaxID=2049346 RepID=A0ABQ9XPZ8_9EUKA|nr:putative Dedicator of cytokinesis protein 3 [Blattamonas nauphoetae]
MSSDITEAPSIDTKPLNAFLDLKNTTQFFTLHANQVEKPKIVTVDDEPNEEKQDGDHDAEFEMVNADKNQPEQTDIDGLDKSGEIAAPTAQKPKLNKFERLAQSMIPYPQSTFKSQFDALQPPSSGTQQESEDNQLPPVHIFFQLKEINIQRSYDFDAFFALAHVDDEGQLVPFTEEFHVFLPRDEPGQSNSTIDNDIVAVFSGLEEHDISRSVKLMVRMVRTDPFLKTSGKQKDQKDVVYRHLCAIGLLNLDTVKPLTILQLAVASKLDSTNSKQNPETPFYAGRDEYCFDYKDSAFLLHSIFSTIGVPKTFQMDLNTAKEEEKLPLMWKELYNSVRTCAKYEDKTGAIVGNFWSHYGELKDIMKFSPTKALVEVNRKLREKNPAQKPLRFIPIRKLKHPINAHILEHNEMLHFSLDTCDFDKGSKKAERNIQAVIEIRKNRVGTEKHSFFSRHKDKSEEDDAKDRLCLFRGKDRTQTLEQPDDPDGNGVLVDSTEGTGEIRSIIFYHSNRPKWNEQVLIRLPPEKLDQYHMYIKFYHMSTTKTSSPFAVCGMPFLENGAIKAPGVYNIQTTPYKDSDDEQQKYLSILPPDQKGKESKGLKGFCQVTWNVRHTSVSFDPSIQQLLDYLPSRQTSLADKINPNPVAIRMNLRAILDSLFGIIDSAESNDDERNNAITTLIGIIKVLWPRVTSTPLQLQQYMQYSFHHPNLHRTLISQLCAIIRAPLDNPGKTKPDPFQIIQQLRLILMFIVKSRHAELKQDADGKDVSIKGDTVICEEFGNLISAICAVLSVKRAAPQAPQSLPAKTTETTTDTSQPDTDSEHIEEQKEPTPSPEQASTPRDSPSRGGTEIEIDYTRAIQTNRLLIKLLPSILIDANDVFTPVGLTHQCLNILRSITYDPQTGSDPDLSTKLSMAMFFASQPFFLHEDTLQQETLVFKTLRHFSLPGVPKKPVAPPPTSSIGELFFEEYILSLTQLVTLRHLSVPPQLIILLDCLFGGVREGSGKKTETEGSENKVRPLDERIKTEIMRKALGKLLKEVMKWLTVMVLDETAVAIPLKLAQLDDEKELDKAEDPLAKTKEKKKKNKKKSKKGKNENQIAEKRKINHYCVTKSQLTSVAMSLCGFFSTSELSALFTDTSPLELSYSRTANLAGGKELIPALRLTENSMEYHQSSLYADLLPLPQTMPHLLVTFLENINHVYLFPVEWTLLHILTLTFTKLLGSVSIPIVVRIESIFEPVFNCFPVDGDKQPEQPAEAATASAVNTPVLSAQHFPSSSTPNQAHSTMARSTTRINSPLSYATMSRGKGDSIRNLVLGTPKIGVAVETPPSAKEPEKKPNRSRFAGLVDAVMQKKKEDEQEKAEQEAEVPEEEEVITYSILRLFLIFADLNYIVPFETTDAYLRSFAIATTNRHSPLFEAVSCVVTTTSKNSKAVVDFVDDHTNALRREIAGLMNKLAMTLESNHTLKSHASSLIVPVSLMYSVVPPDTQPDVKRLYVSLVRSVAFHNSGSFEEAENKTFEVLSTLGERAIFFDQLANLFDAKVEEMLVTSSPPQSTHSGINGTDSLWDESLTEQKPIAQAAAKKFINSILILVDHIKDLTQYDWSKKNENELAHCYLEYIDYLRQCGRLDLMYQKWLSLCELHEQLQNWECAGESYIRLATDFALDSEMTPAMNDYPAQSNRERKTALYQKATTMLEKGEYYERGIELCDELIKHYRYEFINYDITHTLLASQSTLFDKLSNTKRVLFPHHYHVTFIGQGFEKQYLCNKAFIFREKAEVKLDTFIATMKEKFGDMGGQIVFGSDKVPEGAADDKSAQIIRIQGGISASSMKEFEDTKMLCAKRSQRKAMSGDGDGEFVFRPKYVTDYEKNYKIQVCVWKGSVKKGKDKENELRVLFTQKVFYFLEESMPTVEKRIRIKAVEELELTPIQAARAIVQDKNNEIRMYIHDFSQPRQFSAKEVSPFTMILQGSIEAAVSGGQKMFIQAFCDKEFLKLDAEYYEQLEDLMDDMTLQCQLLDEAIQVHRKVCPPQSVELQERLATTLVDLTKMIADHADITQYK